jgi:phytoene desaturase
MHMRTPWHEGPYGPKASGFRAGTGTMKKRADKHIVVVGAGPGGLTAAMILARRGFKVTVLEKDARVGGRNSELVVGDYRFDVGPTFLMMKFLLDEMFEETGRRSEDYLKFLKLEPMYELRFEDCTLSPTSDPRAMRDQIERLFPGESAGFDRLLERERTRFLRTYPCLQKDYSRLTALLAPMFIKALPHLSLTKSLYGVLSGYFTDERLRLAFTFQSKYLGMSPWSCPGVFTMIPYLEYAFGIYHVMGGLNRITHAFAKVIEEENGALHLATPVAKVLVEGKACVGVQLENGEKVMADDVVINADFAHAMIHLFEPGTLRKYTEAKLRKRAYSCSTFMLYLGLDTCYDMPHHTIVFAKDYRKNLEEITERKILSRDISFYVRNASINDPELAPAGHSAVYVLVPVPNNSSAIDWEAEAAPFRERVLDAIEARTAMRDIRRHITAEAVITPRQWENDLSVFYGATFNLSHHLTQMVYFRPRNAFEELRNCYLVGGGTHPGSGLPTIYESGRIAANLLCTKYGVPFEPPPPLSRYA